MDRSAWIHSISTTLSCRQHSSSNCSNSNSNNTSNHSRNSITSTHHLMCEETRVLSAKPQGPSILSRQHHLNIPNNINPSHKSSHPNQTHQYSQPTNRPVDQHRHLHHGQQPTRNSPVSPRTRCTSNNRHPTTHPAPIPSNRPKPRLSSQPPRPQSTSTTTSLRPKPKPPRRKPPPAKLAAATQSPAPPTQPFRKAASTATLRGNARLRADTTRNLLRARQGLRIRALRSRPARAQGVKEVLVLVLATDTSGTAAVLLVEKGSFVGRARRKAARWKRREAMLEARGARRSSSAWSTLRFCCCCIGRPSQRKDSGGPFVC